MKKASILLLLVALMSVSVFSQDTIRASFETSPVCFGIETQFINKSTVPSGLGAVDYKWDFGDGMTSTDQFGKHTYQLDDTLISQVYDVTLTITSRTNPPEMDSVTIQTTVYGLPNVFFTYNVSNNGVDQTVTIDQLSIDDDSYFYQWNLGGVLKSNMKRPTFSGNDLAPFVDGNDHSFTLFIRSPDGCENQYNGVFNYDALGIETTTNNILKMFPNPAQQVVNLSQEFDKVSVIGVTGEIVLSDSQTQTLNLGNVAPGIYVVHAQRESGTYTGRLLVR